MAHKLRYKPYGDEAVLIQWIGESSPESYFYDILAFSDQIQKESPTWLIGIIPAADSLCVVFSTAYELETVKRELQKVYDRREEVSDQKNIWRIPVCYGNAGFDGFKFDLESLAANLGLSKAEVIALHTSRKLLIQFHGFLPGFVYLGGLPERIHYPRRDQARKIVYSGSVGIGGSQSGIYAIDSPGGWNIIGRTPIVIFQAQADKPTFFQPGDQLQFVSISKDQFNDIQEELVERGKVINTWEL